MEKCFQDQIHLFESYKNGKKVVMALETKRDSKKLLDRQLLETKIITLFFKEENLLNGNLVNWS